MNVVFDNRGHDDPVDLSAVQHDEQLINALLGDGEVRTATDDEFEVASLFSAARYAVLEAPVHFELTDEQIDQALGRGGRGATPLHSRTRRTLTSLAAGAASVALVLGGLSIVADSVGETPNVGDGQSQQVVSASMIRADLDEAADLLDSGEVVRGVELINSTTSRMGQLDRTAEFDELNQIRVQLWSRATGQSEAAAPAVGSLPTVPRDLPGQVQKGSEGKPELGLPSIELPPAPELPLLDPTAPGTSVPTSPAPTTPTSPEPTTPTSPNPTPTSASKIPTSPASITGASATPTSRPQAD